MCGSNSVHKMPSAPRLNLGGHPRSEKLPAQTAEERNRSATHQMDMRSHTALSPLSQKAAEDNSVNGSPLEQAAFLQALRHVVATTENVGKKFAEEVRRMHYGDIEARRIRGQASARQAMELLEEGIEVLALPMLPAIKETLQ
ncbi:MAG: hypothetical protein JWR68_2204 [Polaromonas sp.]|nr:hypothetical protein [Polaromonas sp.]